MKRYGICAALAVLGLALSSTAASAEEQSSRTQPQPDAQSLARKICYKNSTDQTLYFEIAIGDRTTAGSMRGPGARSCYYIPDLWEVRVSYERKGDVLCRTRVQYRQQVELTSLGNYRWRRSSVSG
uniref:hypothetical protein n=1 Tax=uncultured Altererythrobacter sp. TaxID=500840 RepID=UPI002615C564|nr:hypothetical protein [uncultured Altererythrobacter sp.]